MAFSLSTSLMRGSLVEKISQAQQAGFTTIDISINDIKASALAPDAIARAVREAEMAVGALLPFYNFEGYTGEAREGAWQRLNWHLDMAHALGASVLLIGASGDVQADGDEKQRIADLTEAAKLAQKKKLKIAYLARPWAVYIRDVLDAYRLVEAVGHAAFGLAMNSYFALADGAKPARYRDLDGAKIFIMQLADAPYSEFDIRHLKHEFACLPGLGDLNLTSFLGVMQQIGYQGDLSLARMGQADEAHRARASDGFRALSNLADMTSSQKSALPTRAYAKGG